MIKNMRLGQKILAILFSLIIMSLIGSRAPQAREEINRPKVEYNSGALRDPFQNGKLKTLESQVGASKEEVPASVTALKIQGVLLGGKFPQAIINNKVVKLGDVIDSVQIAGISADFVSVIADNQQYQIATPKVKLDNPSQSKKEEE